jgi:hypothetical protein
MITPLIAAIIIGSFWTGVATTAVVSDSDLFDHSRSNVVISAQVGDDSHIAACHAKYRSYNEDTDMYLGFDGSWHVCTIG